MKNPLIGKFVIVRCRDAGVHAGFLQAAEGRECTLTNSRRLWYWKTNPGAGAFLSGVAVGGVAASSRLGAPITVHLTENCEIIECAPIAVKSIQEHPTSD